MNNGQPTTGIIDLNIICACGYQKENMRPPTKVHVNAFSVNVALADLKWVGC